MNQVKIMSKIFCPECDSNRILKLPYTKNVYICPDCKTRHFRLEDNEWKRDFYGEKEWEKMGSYAGLSYEQVVEQEYNVFSQK